MGGKALCLRLYLVATLGFFSATTASAAGTVETTGDVLLFALPAITLGTTLYLHDGDGSWQFGKGFAANLAATVALKKTVDKTRPNGKGESFPSGHSSVTFQSAAFLHRRYGLRYAWPAYAAASYVAWSRVDSDNHYTVDVVAGAALGIASAMLFTQPYKNATVTPVAGAGFYGINVAAQW
ncbi:MAG: phosphatase PAP2 family protein [Gammaproteobacteria bacterium]|nr:phosphatase PAP2 family protein [Gammaproteobacteria bacterium]